MATPPGPLKVVPTDLERLAKRPEAAIVRAILGYLRLRGDTFPLRMNTGARTDVGKDGTFRFTRFNEPGTPDIIAVMAPWGRMLAIEVKTPTGTTNPRRLALQEGFLRAIRERNGIAFFASSVDEVRAQLPDPLVLPGLGRKLEALARALLSVDSKDPALLDLLRRTSGSIVQLTRHLWSDGAPAEVP
jgi:hypothetical protein